MAYKGQILNIEQDIESLATLLEKLANNEELSLPLTPDQLPILILRKLNQRGMGNMKEFKVNRKHILMWLRFLVENNPLYKNVKIDYQALRLYPEDGSVAQHLPYSLRLGNARGNKRAAVPYPQDTS